MAKINLKKFYYWYTEDTERYVPKRVAKALYKDKRYEHAYDERARYNNAKYSIDIDDESEAYNVFDPLDDPQVLLEQKELFCNLCRALNSLSDIQGRRIEAHFVFGISRNKIAAAEGVDVSAVNQSIRLGLREMKIFLKNAENRLLK